MFSIYRTDLVSTANCFNEILVCEVTMQTGKLFLVNTFYRPPNCDQSFNDNLAQVLQNINNSISNPKICLIGDLNMSNINWDMTTANTPLSHNICNIFCEYHFTQINRLASRSLNDNIFRHSTY